METLAKARVGYELQKWLDDDANAGKTFSWTPEDVGRLIRERDSARAAALRDAVKRLDDLRIGGYVIGQEAEDGITKWLHRLADEAERGAQ